MTTTQATLILVAGLIFVVGGLAMFINIYLRERKTQRDDKT
ncbi:hypothetical protein [Pseudidiomarina donghaiensis]|nr:hypothetical protein [Pseudidiomarina donghaiensis]SFV20282.1 hypothetical protein SAMN04488139_0141 [Pseudidiomarina donghaiensis]